MALRWTSRSVRRTTQLGMSLILVCLVRGDAAGQASSRFETAVSASVGAYESGLDPNGWSRATSVAFRQTVARFIFVEAEASFNRTSVRVVCPIPVGTDPSACPEIPTQLSYRTLGVGVQVPIGRVRPFAGLGRGRMVRAENPAQDSSSRFVGIGVRTISALAMQVEYRQRRDMYSGIGRVTSDQWLFGLSLQLF